MNKLQQEIIMLIVTALFIGMIMTLLIMKIITPTDSLVTTIVFGVFYYWRSSGPQNPSNPTIGPSQPTQTTPQAEKNPTNS